MPFKKKNDETYTQSGDDKRARLTRNIRLSVIVFWLLAFTILLIGIIIISFYHNINDPSKYAGTVAGTFFIVFAIPVIITASCLTSALIIVHESIQDEREFRCRNPDFYKKIPYPRQPPKPQPNMGKTESSQPSAPPSDDIHYIPSFISSDNRNINPPDYDSAVETHEKY